ncbi:MAG: MFS transporter [Chloroflexi bacterium]|jgi:MFS transporter, DHA3 family, macrolide efflux protein|nr:MAG: MFS transporter [Chloroflexota bacterium]
MRRRYADIACVGWGYSSDFLVFQSTKPQLLTRGGDYPYNRYMKTITTSVWWRTAILLWVTQFSVLVSGNAINFALIWQLTTITHSVQTLSILAALTLVPGIVVTPLAGMLSDRMSRRWLMIGAEGLALVPLVVLWQWRESIAPNMIYGVVIWRSVLTAVYVAAFQAALPQIVPSQHFQRVSGIQQVVTGGASLLAPLLGAMIVMAQWLAPAIGAAVIALLVSIVMVAVVRFAEPAHGRLRMPWQQDWADVQQLYRQRHGLGQLVGAAVVLNMCVLPIFSLLPYLVTDYFQAQAWLLAWCEFAGGMGMILAAVVLAVWGGFRRTIHTLIVAVVLLGVAMTLLALTPPTQPYLLVVALGVIGWAAAWAHGPLLSLLQANVPATMHGRAMAVLSTAMNVAAPVGIVVAGAVMTRVGPQWWAASVALVVALVVYWALRGPLMDLDR